MKIEFKADIGGKKFINITSDNAELGYEDFESYLEKVFSNGGTFEITVYK